MIENILPLTQIRVEILSELYIEPLLGREVAERINRKPQVTYNTLTAMKDLLDKKQNIYSIKPEIEILLRNLLVKVILEKRLGKYYSVLPYIKKHLEPVEMIFFGSFYRGDYNDKSDIDVYIISDIETSLVREVERKLSKAFERKIQIINVGVDVHLSKKDKFSELYNSISNDKLKGIKVPLDII